MKKEESGTNLILKLNVDFEELQQQKAWLVTKLGEEAEGLLNLLDHIQDHAVDNAGIPEEEVFGKLTAEVSEPLSLAYYMDRIKSGYCEGLDQYLNDEGRFNGQSGDTLAAFTVNEISENFSPDKSLKDNLEISAGLITQASEDLDRLGTYIRALMDDIDEGVDV